MCNANVQCMFRVVLSERAVFSVLCVIYAFICMCNICIIYMMCRASHYQRAAEFLGGGKPTAER